MSKVAEYRVFKSNEDLKRDIRVSLQDKDFRRRNNISYDYSDEVGIDISSTFSFATFRPNLGPLVKLNIHSVNKGNSEDESRLILKRVNGSTYKFHVYFPCILGLISLFIALYQIVIGNNIGFKILLFPLFMIGYILFIELVAISKISSFKSKALKILEFKNIRYSKI